MADSEDWCAPVVVETTVPDSLSPWVGQEWWDRTILLESTKLDRRGTGDGCGWGSVVRTSREPRPSGEGFHTSLLGSDSAPGETVVPPTVSISISDHGGRTDRINDSITPFNGVKETVRGPRRRTSRDTTPIPRRVTRRSSGDVCPRGVHSTWDTRVGPV